MAMQEMSAGTINRSEMTQVLSGSDMVSNNNSSVNPGDIPVDEINGAPEFSDVITVNPTGNLGSVESFPVVLPNNPTFRVPANPLLPEEYSEILDYNSIQYLNGIFRTQIGRFVRVEQLVGSNTLQEYDGFLIGVGINYIILQEYSNNNIRIMDIYGIKNMYVYYTNVTRPFITDEGAE